MEYRTNNQKIIDALSGLAYWVANTKYTEERFGVDSKEANESRYQAGFPEFADQLDKMNVPFWVQNSVAAFAENWRRYKSEYMADYLKKTQIYFSWSVNNVRKDYQVSNQ